MKKLFLMTTAALFAATPLMAQQAAPDSAAPQAAEQAPATGVSGAAVSDLVTTAQAQGQFSVLTRAIEAAGMVDQLKGATNVTMFAPTDAAFAALPAGTVDDLLKPQNQAKLKALLSSHLVTGYASSDFLAKQDNAVMDTLGGTKVKIDSADGAVTVSGAKVVTADVRASNGLILGIDRVLLPETQASAGHEAPAGM
jgi:uncharacterized surface protein with fasciclin (FAS1) repeats